MNSTFALWRKTLSQLIKMEDKKEWDALDILSKWFIATRSAVACVGRRICGALHYIVRNCSVLSCDSLPDLCDSLLHPRDVVGLHGV